MCEWRLRDCTCVSGGYNTVHNDSFLIVYFVYYNSFIIPSTFVRYVYTSDIMYTGKLQLN